MPDAIESLVYEQMLLQRHAVHSTAPYGRQAHLDRSATVLLARLVAEGPMTVAQLAEAFGLDVSTVHRQLTAAIKHGLIEKIRDPEGGAAWLHRPSGEGRLRLGEELEARRTAFAAVTEDWNADDVRRFAELMRRFNEAVEAQRSQPWPRPEE
ncbi:MAG: MarR family winged helix-turn-helix transcriptional regulator [Tessaracoccus sp.]